MKPTSLECLFESRDVVVVAKPAGFLSVPSIKGKKDPRPVVGLIAQERWGKLFPVHRLDLEVAGLLVFARHPMAQRILGQAWENEQVRKTYRAISGLQSFAHWPEAITGADRGFKLSDPKGIWLSQLVQGKKRSFVGSHGQASKTEYQVLRAENSVMHWNLFPITGRRHQLRVELSRHGFPILGDTLYGGVVIKSVSNEIALVAEALHFNKINKIELPEFIQLDWNWKQWEEKFSL